MKTNRPTLRSRCETVVRALEIPRPFSLPDFCQAIATQRGRPILLRAVRTSVGLCGLWLPLPECDVIFFEEQTSPLHQVHIVLHELSHLLLDHQPKSVDDPEVLRLLFPDFSVDTIQFVLERTTYAAQEEQEAELLASLILARTVSISVGQELSDVESLQLVRRLSSALEDTPGVP